MRTLKILLIPPNDWLSFPVSSRLHSIFERLAERHDVYVIRYPNPLWLGKRKTKTIVYEATGIPIHDLSAYYVINSLKHIRTINNIIKSVDIDIIIFANILTGAESVFLGKTYGIPIVCDYIDHFPESASSYYNNLLAESLVNSAVLGITKWNLKKANHIVTVSSSFYSWLDNIGLKNISLIPNGVDIQQFKPEDVMTCRQKLGIKKLNQKLVITYAGAVENWYDLNMVASATHKLNKEGISAIFHVVGGHLANFKNNIFDGFEDDVFQTGFVAYKEVPTYINASDVCVLPLKNKAKNLTRPLKLLEYFACGKPVFSLPNQELEREFGDALNIFHTAEELKDLLKRYVRMPEEFASKIKKGKGYASENSWDLFAQKYEHLLSKVMANNVLPTRR